MATLKTKKNNSYKKLYLVSCPGESFKIFSTFVEAETVAKELCEKYEEDVEIFEVTNYWEVLPPENPEPETNEVPLSELLDIYNG